MKNINTFKSVMFAGKSVMLAGLAFAITGCAGVEQKAGDIATRTAQRAASSQASSAQTVPVYPVEAFFETTSYAIAGSDQAFFPDGKSLLVTSDETGIFNAYKLDLDTGARTRMTTSTDNANIAIGVLGDESILYTADGGGDELNHIYLRSPDGTIRDLTPGEKTKADFAGWTADGQAFFALTNERDPAYFDLYRYDATTFARTLIFKNEIGMDDLLISDDGSMLAGIKERTSADNNIYFVDLATKAKPRLISQHEGNVAHRLYSFTPAKDKLIYGTDAEGEFIQAFTYDLSNGEKVAFLAADWDVSFIGYSPSGRYRAVGVNADASLEVTLRDETTGEVVAMPASLPSGDLRNMSFAPDEQSIAFIINSSTSPSNIYHYDLNGGGVHQLTDALAGKVNPDHLVEAQVIRYPSYDGLEIPSIQYRPKMASADNPVPAIVLVHGGPGGQSRKGYSAMIQHLTNNGFAVLAANNRGSIGYGKTFYHLDDKRHGDVDLKDIVEAKSYLAGLDWVDGDNIAVMGGSYGGYMTMAALAFHPEVFDAGVNIFGVTNWTRTLQSIPPWWESFRESLYDEMGDPATDADRHQAISPLFHADTITKPVLIVQGANDPRVLQVESDEMVAAIQANNVPVDYILFPDEGHGFRKRDNRITASRAYVAFLSKWLKDEYEGQGSIDE